MFSGSKFLTSSTSPLLRLAARRTLVVGRGAAAVISGEGRWNRALISAAGRQQKRMMGEQPQMPVPQSMKAELFAGHKKNEGWETSVYVMYSVSFALIVLILGFTPDTEITGWAQREAAARLKLKEGGFENFEFGKHYQGLSPEEAKVQWEKFSEKAVRMNDDDDDDEDDEDEDEEDDE